jgi:hypothetical protein
MAHVNLNIYHVQAKITNYLDLLDSLQTDAGEHGNTHNIIQQETLKKITTFLLANEDKWLNEQSILLYEIADSIVQLHYSQY